MLATFVIGLREGLEAALIVGIIAAFLKRTDRRDALRKVWIGVGVAIAAVPGRRVSLLQLVSASLPQRQQEMLECVVAAIAVVMVSYMVLWMKAHSRDLQADLQDAAGSALARGSAGRAGRDGLPRRHPRGLRDRGLPAGGVPVGAVPGAGRDRRACSASRSPSPSATWSTAAACGSTSPGSSGSPASCWCWSPPGWSPSTLRAAYEAGWLTVGQQTALDLSAIARPGSVQESLLTGMLGIRSSRAGRRGRRLPAVRDPDAAVVLWPPKRTPSRRTCSAGSWSAPPSRRSSSPALLAVRRARRARHRPARRRDRSSSGHGSGGSDRRPRPLRGTATVTASGDAAPMPPSRSKPARRRPSWPARPRRPAGTGRCPSSPRACRRRGSGRPVAAGHGVLVRHTPVAHRRPGRGGLPATLTADQTRRAERRPAAGRCALRRRAGAGPRLPATTLDTWSGTVLVHAHTGTVLGLDLRPGAHRAGRRCRRGATVSAGTVAATATGAPTGGQSPPVWRRSRSAERIAPPPGPRAGAPRPARGVRPGPAGVRPPECSAGDGRPLPPRRRPLVPPRRRPSAARRHRPSRPSAASAGGSGSPRPSLAHDAVVRRTHVQPFDRTPRKPSDRIQDHQESSVRLFPVPVSRWRSLACSSCRRCSPSLVRSASTPHPVVRRLVGGVRRRVSDAAAAVGRRTGARRRPARSR